MFVNFNNEIRESSIFSGMFDKIKTLSIESKQNVGLIIGSAILISIISPIISNLYIYNKLFIIADKFSTKFSSLFIDTNNKLNSERYIDDLRNLTSSYPNINLLNKKLKDA